MRFKSPFEVGVMVNVTNLSWFDNAIVVFLFGGLKRSFKTSSKGWRFDFQFLHRHDTRMIVSAEGGVSVGEFFEFYLKNKLYRFIRGNVEFGIWNNLKKLSCYGFTVSFEI